MLINLLQRYHLWMFLFLSGLSGLALGNLGATILGGLAGSVSVEALTVAAPAPTAAKNLSLTDYKSILTRNIFNSAGSSQGFSSPKATQTAGTQRTRTASKWVLIGTLSGGRSPMATLKESTKTATYRLKEKLPDGATLSAISRNRVELLYPGGRVQVLEIAQDKPSASAPKQPRRKIKSTGPRIENLGNNRWRIPALVAENSRANIGDLLKQAQAAPYLEAGQTTGFQIIKIQPGSLIAQLGLKKGDILKEINGLQLNSPEKALQVFGQLRQAKKISIALERRGKAMSFAYEIK